MSFAVGQVVYSNRRLFSDHTPFRVRSHEAGGTITLETVELATPICIDSDAPHRPSRFYPEDFTTDPAHRRPRS